MTQNKGEQKELLRVSKYLKFKDDVDNHIKVMLGNFDVGQYVYLFEHKLMLVYDNLNDEVQVLWVLLVLVHVDYVHDDIHLNVYVVV
jgi:hypothetical protein